MKTLIWILGLLGFIGLIFFVYSKWRDYMTADNATNKQDKAANIQSAARDRQAGAAYTKILPPAASYVRMNGAIIDANYLGGVLPPLVTLPAWPSYLPPG